MNEFIRVGIHCMSITLGARSNPNKKKPAQMGRLSKVTVLLLLNQLILLNKLPFVGVEIKEIGSWYQGVFKINL